MFLTAVKPNSAPKRRFTMKCLLYIFVVLSHFIYNFVYFLFLTVHGCIDALNVILILLLLFTPGIVKISRVKTKVIGAKT